MFGFIDFWKKKKKFTDPTHVQYQKTVIVLLYLFMQFQNYHILIIKTTYMLTYITIYNRNLENRCFRVNFHAKPNDLLNEKNITLGHHQSWLNIDLTNKYVIIATKWKKGDYGV